MAQAQEPAKFIAASRTLNGETAFIYLPVGGDIKINPASETAQWFNPRNGQWSDARIDAGIFRAPDQQDWLLKLQLKK